MSSMSSTMGKNTIVFQCVFVLIACLALGYWGSTQWAISFLMGFLLMAISVGILYWMMKRLVEKKAVAVGLMVVVFKYAIWFLLLYFLSKSRGYDVFWVMAGILSSLLGFVGAGLMFKDTSLKEGKQGNVI